MRLENRDLAATAKLLALEPGTDLADPAVRRDALDTLEGGGVVVVVGSGFEATERERELMSDTRRMLAGLQEEETRNGRPTLIYEPWKGRLKRTHFASVGGRYVRSRVQEAVRPELEAMMARFGRWAAELIAVLFPGYPGALEPERITYRPHGRRSVQRLHIDSAYGYPTQGRGMLRLFCNVDPAKRPRVWQVGEPFEPFARRFVARSHPKPPGFVNALARSLGIVRGVKTDYDQLMAEMREVAKQDQAYQSGCPMRVVEFPAGSCWFALTDLVLHGGVSGQHSLDQTFYLPAAAMADPSRSSLRILERLAGRPLA